MNYLQTEITRLKELGLVKEKVYASGLRVVKYTNRVFFDALWEESPLLSELRGLVLDENYEVVMHPFTKVYNYGERESGLAVAEDTPVRIVQKINGFMAQATPYAYDVLVGTTGTLDSEYAHMARPYILEGDIRFFDRNFTYLFEIVAPEDPHIVDKEPGAYLIGVRNNKTSVMLSEGALDYLAGQLGYKRPYHKIVTMAEALELKRTVLHEGYIVQHLDGSVICKMKSNHYLSKKALMRMGKASVNTMYDHTEEFKKRLDEEFYTILEYIVQNVPREDWAALHPQKRREIVEEFYTHNNAF